MKKVINKFTMRKLSQTMERRALSMEVDLWGKSALDERIERLLKLKQQSKQHKATS